MASSRLNLHLLLSTGVFVLGGCSFPERTFVDDDVFYDSGVGATGGGGLTGGTGGTGAGGTGGTGAGGTGGTGAGGTGGTGGGGSTENCTNGIDDDGNGLIDCADPGCGDHYCMPEVPAGWSGPVVHYDGAGTAPNCTASGGYPVAKDNYNSQLNPGTVTCQTCTCEATGATCEVDMIFYQDPTCPVGGGCWGYKSGTRQCAPTPPPPQPEPEGIKFTLPPPAQACQFVPTLLGQMYGAGAVWTGPSTSPTGTCTPGSTGTKTIPTPTWDHAVRACGDGPTTGKGCGTTGTCLPPAASPYETSPCIYRAGDHECPSGAGFIQKTVYGGVSDTRDCGDCGSCTSTSVSCRVELFTDDNCTQGATLVPTPNSCTPIPPDADPLTTQVPNPNGAMPPYDTRAGIVRASCPVAPAAVTGAATPTDPVTFCCL